MYLSFHFHRLVLTFQGKKEQFNSQHNLNYLSLLELITEYDPFSRVHIEKYGNHERDNPLYLSKSICNQLKTIVKTTFIIGGMKKVRYFFIIIDLTPDY